MAQFYLINSIVFAGNRLMPGSLVDDNTDDTAKLRTAGAVLWPATDAVVAAAALVAQNALKNRASNEIELASIMQAAVDSVQRTNDTNVVTGVGTATLVAGTVVVNPGVAITASSKITLTLNTPGGATNGSQYKVPTAGRTVGAAGVGTFTVTAVDTAGATVATDVSTLDYAIHN